MQSFLPISHEILSSLLIQLFLLLLVSRLFGEIFLRLGQSSVIGEILAGVILGPTLISGLIPGAEALLIPQTASGFHLLEIFSLVGVMLLLLVTGMETDIELIRRHARTASAVSLGGVLATFSTGFALAFYIPEGFLPDDVSHSTVALFFATAMSVSAIPVLAKVLMDLGMMRRNIGQTMIAAGMSDDAIGWVLLAVSIALAGGAQMTPGSISLIVFEVLAILGGTFVLGAVIARPLFRFIINRSRAPGMVLSAIIALLFAFAAITEGFHLEPVVGTFILGIVLANVFLIGEDVREQIKAFTFSVFSPLFFAIAGLKVDLRQLSDPKLLGLTLATVLVAMLGKIIGTYIGARFIGRKKHWYSLSFGMGLNARGAMQIIVATVGYDLGFLTGELFTIIVITSIVTSVLAPTALRFVLQRVPPDEEEINRLKREKLLKDNPFARLDRVLLPVRRSKEVNLQTRTTEAKMVNRLHETRDFALTLFTVSPPGEKQSGTDYLDKIKHLFQVSRLERKASKANRALELILEEARKKYDLMILGAPLADRQKRGVYSPAIDYLIRFSPIPTLIVSGRDIPEDWQPRRILVPTNGTEAARKGARLAFALASEGDQVILLNVARSSRFSWLDPSRKDQKDKLSPHRQMVKELVNEGQSLGVECEGVLLTGSSPENEIMQFADRNGIDLIILGTDIRTGSRRLFLGPRVETMLYSSSCPVAVINA